MAKRSKTSKPFVFDDADVQKAADVILKLPKEQLDKSTDDDALVAIVADVAWLHSQDTSKEWREGSVKLVKKRVEFGLASRRRGYE